MKNMFKITSGKMVIETSDASFVRSLFAKSSATQKIEKSSGSSHNRAGKYSHWE